MNDYLQLIDKIKAGDKNALNALIVEVKTFVEGKIVGYKKSFGQYGIDSDEASQLIYIKMHSIVDNYNPDKCDFLAYLSKCITNACNTIIKNKKKLLEQIVPIENGEDNTTEIGDGGQDIKDVETKDAVNMVLAKLQEVLTQKEFDVVMMFSKGYRYDEIATELNLEKKKVDNLLYSARKKIKKYKDEILKLLK